MNLRLMILSTAAAVMMTPMWAQQQPTTIPEQQSTAPSESSTAGTQASQQSGTMQTWTLSLYDVDCKAATPSERCEVTPVTKTYGFMTPEGKTYKMSDEDMAKVRKAVQEHEKEAKSSGQTSKEFKAVVAGTMEGDNIKVDTVRIE